MKGAIIILTLEETFSWVIGNGERQKRGQPEVNYALFSANGAHVVHLGVNTCQGRGDGAFSPKISISELIRVRFEVLID